MRKILFPLLAIVAGLLLMTACPAATPTPTPTRPAATPTPAVKKVKVLLLHRQTGVTEALQQKIIDEFNAANPDIQVVAESLGDYTKLYQKVLASITAGDPPDMAATYESMAGAYMRAGALVAFDDYIKDPQYGLSAAELADIIPSYLEAGKFAAFGGKILTFPYTRSSLLMYTNLELLKQLGFKEPAKTWDEFLTHCRAAVKAGKQGYAMNVDPSTFNGIVFSYGGEVISADGKKLLYDQPAAMKAFQLLETLYKEKLAYRVTGYDDQVDVSAGKALYMMRSSTTVPFMKDLFKDDTKWAATVIPQGTPDKKVTVLYGAAISIFKTTPERQLAAWRFIKYFNSKDVTALWGSESGYFPVRLSALETPAVKKVIADYPQYASAIEASKYGKVEPQEGGWQEARTVLGNVITGIVTGEYTPEKASAEMQAKGTPMLQ